MSTLDLPRPQVAEAAASSGDAATQHAPSARAWALTMEQLAYLGLGLLALLAHLWALGDRALHHDETLHAAYSWFLYSGRGYIHDPLLHGPLLYHIGALCYWLFGDNDFTARLGAALAGTALTLTPYLIRREIGRLAALAAAVYLLISPVFLYYGRFIRHDIYSVLCEMLVFAAIVRYASTRRPAWLYAGALAFGLMYVNQETSYLFLLIMGAPLALAFLWRVYRPGVAVLGALAVAAVILAFVLPGEALVDGGHNATRDPQTGEMQFTPGPLFGWRPLETDDNGYALRIRNRADNDGGRGLLANLGLYLQDLGKFVGHPAVLLGLGLGLATLGGLWWAIWGRGGQSPWRAAREGGDPVADVFASLGEGRRWLVALAIFGAVYALFFTAFFTNLLGLITGTSGSLLYWLAQHNVQRGGQPRYYYLVQLAIYEPLLLLFGLIGFGLILWDTIRRWRSPAFNIQHSTFSILLIAWWAVGALVIYSWAGEKMPWLTTHVALPLVLLAAWAFQRSIQGAALIDPETDDPTSPPSAFSLQPSAFSLQPSAFSLFAALFAVILALCYVLMTAIVGFGESALLQPWAAMLFGLLLLALLTVGSGLRWGARWAIAALAICVAVGGALYTARSAYRLAYQNGDTPVEMLVYTQTSPDVMRVVRRLEEASRRRGNGLAMPVMYDNETVWLWYMRDFSKAQRTPEQLAGPPGDDVMAVLMLDENLAQYPQNRQLLDGFVIQRYPLRWWFPEDQIYRLSPGWHDAPLESVSLLGQLLRAPFDRDVDARLWKFLMFRETGYPLGSSDFVVAVRPEIASQIGVGLGGALDGANP
ncbi:TIGR03663 family protein [Oscillochloris sp. ZM17-4]|uniref:flippase activity-associated protein Agl23 n=1 Tax=Oscillochloris sp. ZM17-4 TaxID=2866714 RepID=UPI001C731168|nr:flippase activity-associated protein Agl23 [Oscillochloris sp. ZM17-4]MBX0329045.1 TIGR03663 family protein [Oscillochloris sp. ZM17-4]